MTTCPQNNCYFVVRFSLGDPKRDLRLATGEAQRFQALDLLPERFFFKSTRWRGMEKTVPWEARALAALSETAFGPLT